MKLLVLSVDEPRFRIQLFAVLSFRIPYATLAYCRGIRSNRIEYIFLRIAQLYFSVNVVFRQSVVFRLWTK